MFCPYCGKELSGQSKFCSRCGKPLTPPEKTLSDIWLTVLCCALGVLLVLGGILPFCMQGNIDEYNAYMARVVYSKATGTEVAAISYFQNFATLLSPLFYFTSSLLAIFAGLLLLMREAKSTLALIVCAATHFLSIIYSGAVYLVIFCFPEAVLSLLSRDEEIIEAGLNMLDEIPGILYYYIDHALLRVTVSLAVIALSVVVIFVKKRYLDGKVCRERGISSIGSILMFPVLSVLYMLGQRSTYYIATQYFGVESAASIAIANQTYNHYLYETCIFAFIVILTVSVLCTRVKRWIIAVPTVAVVSMTGTVAFLTSRLMIEASGTPERYFSPATSNLRGLIISSVLVLIAIFFWFSSVSKGMIPTWLQLALPISLPIIYIIAEIFIKVLVRLSIGISSGALFCALITILISALVGIQKQKTN